MLDRGSKLASIVTFTKAEISLDQMEQYLKENDIVYSVSARNFALIDFMNKNVDWAIRLSPPPHHYFNTVEEIEQVKEVLTQS